MNQISAERRKPYSKPRLRTIELLAEEVLSTGCKNGSINNGAQSPATDPCGISRKCAAVGS